ncbi:MAG TPA: serine hydrolase [Gemmataceae bacterium]|nr:serine hydrolase [Gemmataceae bacterium]
MSMKPCVRYIVAAVLAAFVPAVGTAQREAAVKAIETLITREVQDKQLPALSIALVDDQTIVWAKGFGFTDANNKTPATADTVYRVGSVSKLFTDIGIMQLVERGEIDLDAPVTKYLPDFKPANPFGKPITLRQLMSHRAGLVREPPVGHYFDPTGPTLAQTVESLNRTELIYAPETHTKYSNAGIAVVGYVLERLKGEPFPTYLKHAVLEPLGLQKSRFEPTPSVTKDLSRAIMWTYHGRVFDAPTFSLGMAPAGSMYSTVNDLGRFLSVLFADGKSGAGRVVKPETLEQMWTPQFAKKAEKGGFGIGFHLSDLEGCKCVGHGGAIYGFATTLEALPGEKLGVVVIAAKDCANAVTAHVAHEALKQLLAIRRNKPAPAIAEPQAVAGEEARRVAGRYVDRDRTVELVERDGKLFLLPVRSEFRLQIRRLGEEFVVDDVLAEGIKFRADGDKITLGTNTLRRVSPDKPQPAPGRWAGLIGEYGWDYDTLYIFEKDAKLYALIEWFYYYPLEEVADNVFKFPSWGLYESEKLIFKRDPSGRATEVNAASVVFKRRTIDGENGATFRIKPVRPLDDLRREALAAHPPSETGDFRKPDLVDVTSLDPAIKLDIRYATTNNFLSTPFYTSARAFMQRPAAEALLRVHKKLAEKGYGLVIYDCYRPWYVTKMFWDATPEKQHIFVADPARGSRHNRGCAVDLTLYELKTGQPVQMTGGYDEMSDRSYPDYPGGTSLQRWHRELLRRVMEEQGFTVYEAEWWHFDYKDWRKYPILNVTFENLAAEKPQGSY